MKCACGKTALYRVGEQGYCGEHRTKAVARIETHGNPRAVKKRIGYVRMKPDDLKPIVPRKSKAQKKIQLQHGLKANPTPAEAKLIELLSASSLRRSFDFQPLVYGYIPDFYFPTRKLIVELDGAHHYTTAGKRADAKRTGHLKSQGIAVLRFQNREVFDCPEQTIVRIQELFRARLSRHP